MLFKIIIAWINNNIIKMCFKQHNIFRSLQKFRDSAENGLEK